MSDNFAIRSDLFLLKHPFYQAWVEGRLPLPALQDYARQYFHHVEAFPQYLKNALEHCPNGPARDILLENLSEEDGTAYGTSHPELWLRFAEGVGNTRAEVQMAELRPAIRNVVDTFDSFSKHSFARALGSLYAYESQVPDIAQSKIDGLKAHFGVTDERTLAFFEVHKTADVLHRESLLGLIENLSNEEKIQAREAADQACQALWNFLSDVHPQEEHACA